ncbi:ImmA/IrrE family metallo-endopeptidase [Candidatus Sumerlaeota bacterium]|nr:ImmA/IrrE family metallo-endopeptidase [Candidatus Sumerlaeota bacterium]
MRVEVQPGLLRWARERTGHDLESLAGRFAKLPMWERGEAMPTMKQLESFAKAVHVPVGYLFLAEPPQEQIPVPDFRTMPGERFTAPSPDLLDTIYLCQQRQDWYREFARTVGEPPIPFVGSASPNNDVVETAAQMRATLSFDLEERSRMSNWTDALRRFIELVDAAGVLVMVSGVVGSDNHRKLNPKEFRGFALVDANAPLVFVNGSDTKSAQMFTLAHELAHIWVGQSALSDVELTTAPSHNVERWCDAVAAELLVPMLVFRRTYNPAAELPGELDRLARVFKVSRLVILRRIHDAGGLSREDYRTAFRAELARLQALSAQTEGGGSFYNTLGARVGKRFARAVVVSTLEGRSSFTEAFRMLGFRKMSTFRRLSAGFGMRF